MIAVDASVLVGFLSREDAHHQASVALLAAIGRTHARVHRRPRVAILATGDEVVAPGQPPGPGQIWDSNSAAIAAMVRQAGGAPVPLGIARDNEAEIRARLASDAAVDLIVINKFSKQEASGQGLRHEFAEAITAGMPVLTAVPEKCYEDWRAFTGDIGTTLLCERPLKLILNS